MSFEEELEKLTREHQDTRKRVDPWGISAPLPDKFVPTHPINEEKVPEKKASDMFAACLLHLGEKTAAKVKRETGLSLVRGGKRPMRVAKFLEKINKGLHGWKVATVRDLDEDRKRNGWGPAKEGPTADSEASLQDSREVRRNQLVPESGFRGVV